MVGRGVDLDLGLSIRQASGRICAYSQTWVRREAKCGSRGATSEEYVSLRSGGSIGAAAEAELSVSGAIFKVGEEDTVVQTVVGDTEASAEDHLVFRGAGRVGEAYLWPPVVVVGVGQVVDGN